MSCTVEMSVEKFLPVILQMLTGSLNTRNKTFHKLMLLMLSSESRMGKCTYVHFTGRLSQISEPSNP